VRFLPFFLVLAGDHLLQQVQQASLAEHIRPLCLDGCYNVSEEVSLLHYLTTYAAQRHLHFQHVSQLLEVLKVLEAIDHEQRHETDRRAGRLEDQVGEEHLRLVELAHLHCGGVEPRHDQALVVGFVEVAGQHLQPHHQLLEEF